MSTALPVVIQTIRWTHILAGFLAFFIAPIPLLADSVPGPDRGLQLLRRVSWVSGAVSQEPVTGARSARH